MRKPPSHARTQDKISQVYLTGEGAAALANLSPEDTAAYCDVVDAEFNALLALGTNIGVESSFSSAPKGLQGGLPDRRWRLDGQAYHPSLRLTLCRAGRTGRPGQSCQSREAELRAARADDDLASCQGGVKGCATHSRTRRDAVSLQCFETQSVCSSPLSKRSSCSRL
eukprot:4312273-Pleurochrysis_carterae.AAC.3